MQQFILRHECWFIGTKRAVLEHLQRLEQDYGNISIKRLLQLLQQ